LVPWFEQPRFLRSRPIDHHGIIVKVEV